MARSKSTDMIIAATILGVSLVISIAILNSGWSIKQPDDPMYWIERLETGTEKDRVTAIQVLSAVRPKSSEIVAALCHASSDANAQIRLSAVGALASGWQDWPLAETAVRNALTDKDENIRSLADAIIQGRVIKHERKTEKEDKTVLEQSGSPAR